jgi:hypothetical protein
MSNEAQTANAITPPGEQSQASAPPLHAEEMEAIIAPKLAANHNETFLG